MQRVDSSRFLTCLRIAGPMFSFFSLKYTVPYIVREVGASVNDTGPAFLRAFSREEDAFKSNETRVRSTCSCTRLASSWHSNVMKPYLGAPPKKVDVSIVWLVLLFFRRLSYPFDTPFRSVMIFESRTAPNIWKYVFSSSSVVYTTIKNSVRR